MVPPEVHDRVTDVDVVVPVLQEREFVLLRVDIDRAAKQIASKVIERPVPILPFLMHPGSGDHPGLTGELPEIHICIAVYLYLEFPHCPIDIPFIGPIRHYQPRLVRVAELGRENRHVRIRQVQEREQGFQLVLWIVRVDLIDPIIPIRERIAALPQLPKRSRNRLPIRRFL